MKQLKNWDLMIRSGRYHRTLIDPTMEQLLPKVQWGPDQVIQDLGTFLYQSTLLDTLKSVHALR